MKQKISKILKAFGIKHKIPSGENIKYFKTQSRALLVIDYM